MADSLGGAAAPPPPMTYAGTHDLLVRLLARDFPAGRGALRLLDAPCGAGALSIRLRELGFAVSCLDIDPGNFKAEGFDLTRADLNEPLPFPDGSFDVAVTVAGLQRLTHPERAVAEFHRVLRPGGTLYASVPNLCALRRRVRFLLTGSLGSRFDLPAYRQTIESASANFRSTLTYPRVERMAAAAGFSIAGVETDRSFDPYLLALAPVTALVLLFSRLKGPGKDELEAAWRRNSSLAMLSARAFVLVAKKAPPNGAGRR